MNQRNQSLLQDRYAAHPLLGELRTVLATSESFAAKALAIKIDKHLSPEGRAARTEKLVRSALRDIRDLGRPVNDKRAELAALVARIKPVSFEPTNVAAALLRGEMRAAVRKMSLSERAAVLMGDKADAAFVDAVLEGHAILSGVDENLYEEVREQRLEALFSAETLEVESLSTEVAESDAIFQLARQDISAASGLQPYEFAALEKDVYSKRDAVWLKRERDMNGAEIVIVLEPKSAKTRLADSNDLRDGKYYDNYAAYQADRAA
jgi:hypothetical protein